MRDQIHSLGHTLNVRIVDLILWYNLPMLFVTMRVFLESDLTLVIKTMNHKNLW
jgi:hypothetical protein